MADSSGDIPIFGRYSREECGLPPGPWDGGEPRPRPARVVLLVLALAAAAWMGGGVSARVREMQVAELAARVLAAEPEQRSALLRRGKLYVAALPSRGGMRRNLAAAAYLAAGAAPRRLGYYGNAVNLLAGAEGGRGDNPEWTILTEMLAASLYSEVGKYPEAFAAIERANKVLAAMPDDETSRGHRLNLVNAQAYFLASAGKERGGDPDRALRLAELMITSRDRLPDGRHASSSAPHLDTLATARFAAGDAAGAKAAQTLALGLAASEDLDVYIRHYDEFAERVGKEDD